MSLNKSSWTNYSSTEFDRKDHFAQQGYTMQQRWTSVFFTQWLHVIKILYKRNVCTISVYSTFGIGGYSIQWVAQWFFQVGTLREHLDLAQGLTHARCHTRCTVWQLPGVRLRYLKHFKKQLCNCFIRKDMFILRNHTAQARNSKCKYYFCLITPTGHWLYFPSHCSCTKLPAKLLIFLCPNLLT